MVKQSPGTPHRRSEPLPPPPIQSKAKHPTHQHGTIHSDREPEAMPHLKASSE